MKKENISTLLYIIVMFTGLYWLYYNQYITLENLIVDTCIIIIGMIFLGLIGGLFFITLVGAAKFGKKRSEKDFANIQLTKDDFKKDKEYYREILKINSPLIIGYVDDFDLNKNKLIAEILYLKHKNIIDIRDNQLIKNDNIDENTLYSSDKYILDNIKDGKLQISNDSSLADDPSKDMLQLIEGKSSKENKFMNELRTKIIDDAKLKLELLSDKSVYNEKKKCVAIFLIAVTMFGFGFNAEPENIIQTLMLLGSIFLFFYGANYLKMLDNVGLHFRTKKGEELNEKMEGLKQYLKEYSLLDERETDAVVLWEEYLIYSVMFGQNTKAIEEFEKYIN